jgi:uncharacterized ion transporter superfamily protein YfcC
MIAGNDHLGDDSTPGYISSPNNPMLVRCFTYNYLNANSGEYMEQQKSAQISRNSFIQSFVILLILIILAGVLTRVIPAGNYERVEKNGIMVVNPDSFASVDHPNYPVWRWFTAPVEILAGPDALTIITILLFLLMIGAAFSVLQHSGILTGVLHSIVRKFGSRKHTIIWIVTFFFMCLGAFFGSFEEIIPLVPIMVVLAISLGWDSLVGLGMSLLATNLGFSTALTNPFTIGVAQKLASLPPFSGFGLRLVFFGIVYVLFCLFLSRYARKLEKNPQASPIWKEEEAAHLRENQPTFGAITYSSTNLKPALIFFGCCLGLIALCLFLSPFVSFLSSYSLPIIAVFFLIGGLGAGFLSGIQSKNVWKAALDGMLGIAPGIPLILMASSIKYIVTQGQILDTILHSATGWIQGTTPLAAALIVYALALFVEFFIGSGSAKAFLLMPILTPLADLVGVTRQVTVTAYCFGDGFSNVIYPTNPVLLIALGLTVVGFSKWFKWTAKLWAMIFPLTIIFLAIAVAIHYGPF